MEKVIKEGSFYECINDDEQIGNIILMEKLMEEAVERKKQEEAEEKKKTKDEVNFSMIIN